MASRQLLAAALVCGLVFASQATATIPYGSVTGGTPGLGPGLASPADVPGKEYSHDMDHMITAVGVSPAPEQVVAWDGSGGVANGVSYVGQRPTLTMRSQVDAIANHGDYLFNPLRRDDAHLIFSFDDMFNVVGAGGILPAMLPSSGPVMLSNGKVVGGAGELSYELGLFGGANGPETQGLWASQASINGMPFPRDIDGVEVWGPEPAFTADANKYSLDVDAFSGFGGLPATSIWNAPVGSPYVSHAAIVSAVESLLGIVPPGAVLTDPTGNTLDGRDTINLDALMVRDSVGSSDEFERDPTGGSDHDRIIFSIEQIANPLDPDGYYATGSELFVLDGATMASFLRHGGHMWDHGYALGAFGLASPDQRGVLDINAIEAVSEFVVPEPISSMLMGLGLAALGIIRRK